MATVLSGCQGSPETADPSGGDRSASSGLQSLWWTWVSTAPSGRDPVEDATGDHCDERQPDHVWLVAGTYGGTVRRECRVPSGVPLAGPAVTAVTPTRDACVDYLDQVAGEVMLDGKPQRLESLGPERITFESGDGLSDGYGCGLWVRIRPLDPGQHVLSLLGRRGSVKIEAVYHLTVV